MLVDKNHPDQEALLADILAGSCTIMGVEILETDIEIRRAERDGYGCNHYVGDGEDASHVSLVLDMQDTPHPLHLLVISHVVFNPRERT